MSRPDRDLERVHRLARLSRAEDVTERHQVAMSVGHLDADRRAAGDRSEDPHVGRRHRVGDVLVQARDAGDLDARRELELVAGHGRADGHADEPCLDPVGGERPLEHAAGLFDQPFVDLLRRAAQQQVQRGELPSALLRGRAERDLELLDHRLCLVLVLVIDVDIEARTRTRTRRRRPRRGHRSRSPRPLRRRRR